MILTSALHQAEHRFNDRRIIHLWRVHYAHKSNKYQPSDHFFSLSKISNTPAFLTTALKLIHTAIKNENIIYGSNFRME